MWDLMLECLELYSQINPFVVLNLLNFMVTNNKFINSAFIYTNFLFFGLESLGTCILLLVFCLAEIKVGLSPSKKVCVICLIESPLKMIRNAFYFILKALFVLKISKFLSQLFGHLGKTT